MPGQHWTVGHFPIGALIQRLLEQIVEAVHRHFGMLPAGEDHGQLHQRCDGARREQATGHQRTGCNVALHYQIAAENQHPGIGDLLDGRGPATQPCPPDALLHADVGSHGVGMFPLALEVRLSLQGLDIFDALNGLHQHRVADRALTHPLFRQLRHWPLDEDPRDHNQRNGDQRDDHQRTAHQRHNAEEQQYKRDIHRRADGGRGEQLAHLVNLTQLGDKRAGGFGSGVVLDRHRAGKKERGDIEIDMLAHNVRDMGTGQADHKLQQGGEQHTDKQHPQGGDRLGGNNPIIDLHREEDPRQGQHVAQHRSQGDLRELALGVAEVPPEPVLLPGTGKVVDAGVAPAGGNAEHHHLRLHAGEQRLQRLLTYQVAPLAQPVGHQPVGINRLQQHQLAGLQLHDDRQVLRVPTHLLQLYHAHLKSHQATQSLQPRVKRQTLKPAHLLAYGRRIRRQAKPPRRPHHDIDPAFGIRLLHNYSLAVSA